MAGFEVSGVSGFGATIDALIARVEAATERCVQLGAAAIETAAKGSMNSPGPQVRTGTLRRSIGIINISALGAGQWQATVAPTTVYGRRMELGFHSVDSLGRNYGPPNLGQPAYPYMQPGLTKAMPLLPAIFEATWGAALGA
jgi:hypothetical protein